MTGSISRRAAAAALAFGALCGQASAAVVECDPAVQSAMDRQVSAYVSANGDLAAQNYSKRPGNFASTTCLDNLMKGGGVDIFFKPQNLDSLVGLVKNMACDQASQIFDSLVSGGGLNGGGTLNPGELLKGVDLSGSLVPISPSSPRGSSNPAANAAIRSLFK